MAKAMEQERREVKSRASALPGQRRLRRRVQGEDYLPKEDNFALASSPPQGPKKPFRPIKPGGNRVGDRQTAHQGPMSPYVIMYPCKCSFHKGNHMDRQWMYADWRSKEFIEGVHYFLRVAEANKRNGFTCCPCNKCKNQKEYSVSRTIHFHLFESGFMPSYNCWTSHGEQGVEMEEGEVEDNNLPDWAQYAGFEGNQTGEVDRDAGDNDAADDLGQMLQDAKEDCESCKQGHKKLDTTLEFLQWKAKNGVSDKAFGDLLKLVNNILPEGNKLPKTTYEAKKIVCPLGLEVQKIHACPNDCILYRGEEYENLEACPVCKALRYKIRRDDPGEVDGQLTKKRIPAKVMWYFPIIPWLRRLFRNKGNARMMRWHAKERQQDGMLRHPADGSPWRNIDRKFKDFGKDARNIWFGLSMDGMNCHDRK
uniref:OSJNBb0033G08.10 protein n=1 Tax=Oryza sativa subsp. japonica TaxID=39947 RepID=Q7XSE4_ORYSJ|nr:OSJNBb0033G08.10 [Oryza sativa Japonica Group]